MSGTSMATSLVAGCVALMREAVQKKNGKQHRSAALIKALLVNGAINYSSPDGPGFDYQQGFGQVGIDKSIAMIENGTLTTEINWRRVIGPHLYSVRFQTRNGNGKILRSPFPASAIDSSPL
ncbi:hypothetical protein QQZ08_010653 [Neonectria magnoliae]|uniref:Peptidase S8/S53 domain-containing protein n=1 Tax=Neonectria magnoliae TaxID=2732573 RepID=A0ABR1HFP3_9HYPO